MKISTENITPVEELEDGSTIYEVGASEIEPNSDNSFYANLAEDMTDSSRHKLSTYLLEQIDEDMYKLHGAIVPVDWAKQQDNDFKELSL